MFVVLIGTENRIQMYCIGNKKQRERWQMGTNNFLRIVLISATLIFFSFSFFGCSKEGPFGPGEMESINTLNIIKRTSQEMKFLNAKTTSLKKVMNAQQLITVVYGGTIEVGDETTGISSITFNSGDVQQDVNVNFNWDSNNFLVEFSPHGATFNFPVRVRLSYKDANLTGVNEDNLRIWYFNEQDNMWERCGGIVNKEGKYVETTTTHFSKYGVGGE